MAGSTSAVKVFLKNFKFLSLLTDRLLFHFSKHDDSETETGIHRFSDEIDLPSPSSAVKSIVSKEDIPAVNIPAASSSTETSLTLDQAAIPETTAIALSTHSMITHKQESGVSFPCTLSLQQSSTLESMKIGHAALTRTDSISSNRTVASRNSSYPLQQIVEEGRGGEIFSSL